MFTVYHSNKVDTLKILLVHLIKSDPLANPFEKEQILVQSPGMSQWLKMELAKEFGTSRYQALKVVLESAFGWNERYQIYPTKGIIFEAKKIARKYLRLKKKVEKKKMSKRLIRDALGSRR